MSKTTTLDARIYGELELYTGMVNQSCWTLRQISQLDADEINEMRQGIENEMSRLHRNMMKVAELYAQIQDKVLLTTETGI
jgi:hypothetical protein